MGGHTFAQRNSAKTMVFGGSARSKTLLVHSPSSCHQGHSIEMYCNGESRLTSASYMGDG